MVRHTEIKLTPSDAQQQEIIKRVACKQLGIKPNDTFTVVVERRSIDARSRQPYMVLGVAVYDGKIPHEAPILETLPTTLRNKRVVIVGAGPAGYFAALELLGRGIKPIVVDRGKDVRSRRRDLRAIQQFGVVNPDSNYCFGEGGAGTYSDGKLYTRSVKRGDVKRALRLLVEHGATEDILVDTHPHIGSNKLPKVVSAIRETIEHLGGEVRFDSRVTDFIMDTNSSAIRGVVLQHGEEILADAVILATGHSARDIFELCHKRGITVEAKPLAMGVRIEHPQTLIDEIQYKQNPREYHLPASSYRLACQVEERGVYSFCMCPGGLIVPAATAPNETVVNGMSMSRRDSAFANSGMVVEISEEDLQPYRKHGVFAALEYQKELERIAYKAGGDATQRAPAQRITDFVQKRVSSSLPDTSYIPGIHSAPLHEVLPAPIAKRLQKGLVEFGKRMKGYFSNEAIIVGVESRTSSPIKIPRQSNSLEHVSVKNLYPCAEGAGYAGGIISAAMDGQRVAHAIADAIL